VLRTPNRSEAAPLSFESVRRQDGDFVVEILRHGVRMRDRMVPAREIASGPLRLEAKRAGDRLLFQVNDFKPLVYQDLFPLGDRQTGVFGLHWPSGVRLESLRAYRQTLATLSSPLERGDELYAQRRFDEALLEYRDQANTSRQPEVRQEARYKAGLCLLGRNQPDQAMALFQQLAEDAAGERWPLLARCQLWLRLLGQGRLDEADLQFALIKGRFSFQELSAQLSPELRDGILKAYDMAVGVNLVLVPPDELIRNQQRAFDVKTFLQSSPTDLLLARHRLFRAHRMTGDERQAIRLGVEILSSYQALDATDLVRQTVVQYVWALRHAGEAARALAEVDRWMFSSPGVYRPDIERSHSLLIERARVHAALREWKLAEDDLEQFFHLHPPSAGRADAFVVEACLLQGFLRERRGDAPEAQEVWNRALPSTGIFREGGPDIGGGSMFVHYLILAALTGRMTDEESNETAKRLIGQMAGASSSSGWITRLYAPPPQVLRRMWLSPRGREWARRFAFRDLSLAEHSRVPAFLLGYEVLHQGAFPETLSADQDEVLWKLIQGLYFSYLGGKLKEDQATSILLAWIGFFGASWEGAIAKLEPSLRGPMAYLAGHRCLRKDATRKKESLRLFELALKEGASDPILMRLAKTEIDRLKAK
jgi:tetratricopeptide (TPR) repeat protein